MSPNDILHLKMEDPTRDGSGVLTPWEVGEGGGPGPDTPVDQPLSVIYKCIPCALRYKMTPHEFIFVESADNLHARFAWCCWEMFDV